MKEKILVVEDEEDIRDLVRFNLEREGYRVVQAATGEEGLDLARRERPDLILLDLLLPGRDGLEVCRELKRDQGTSGIPVVMLTARAEEADIVTGLEVGADNYVTKPFSPRVLAARVKAQLRARTRPPTPETEILRRGELEVDPGRHEARWRGRPLDLTFTEFRLLQALAGRPGLVFSRYQLVNAVRGENYVVTDRAVDVQVAGLRRKLGEAADLVETVRGVGYRFREQAAPPERPEKRRRG